MAEMKILKSREKSGKTQGEVNVHFKKSVNLPFDVKKCVLKIMDCENRKNAVINIIFASDGLVKMINTEYRLKNKTTDVIAFEFKGRDCKCPGGDIFISVEMARKNAKEFGATVNAETARLITHGTLHVLGYDHLNPADEKVMLEKTEEYMKCFLVRNPDCGLRSKGKKRGM
jgi:probable rRNA maturation factor